MKTKIKFASILTFFLMISVPEIYPQNLDLNLNLLYGVPKNEFSDNLEGGRGFGLAGSLGYHLGNSPLRVGLEVGALIYGSETRKEPFPNIPEVTLDVKTSNNILLLHPLIRIQGKSGFFRPYLDGLIGWHYFFTKTEIKSEDDIDEEPIFSSTQKEDWVFSYGLGGGLMIRIINKLNKEQKSDSQEKEVLLDFRVRYLYGGKAEYLKQGSVRRENGQVFYDVLNSKTDMLTFQLGVVYTF
ncbi:MAG: hypothetical protein ACE5HS_01765 [bacterium]